MSDVQVTPGEIDEFAKEVAALHDTWTDVGNPASTLAQRRMTQPSFGSFVSATTAQTSYETKLDGFATAFQQLAVLLDDVRQASEKIAKNYKDAESLANASVIDVDTALAEAMSDETAGSATGNGDSSGNTGTAATGTGITTGTRMRAV